MGFSVSGSFAILVLAAFIAFGTFYGAVSNGADRVMDAQRAAFDDRLDRQNTAINVTGAEWQTELTTDTLEIEVENTGTTTLRLNDTDVLVDDAYVSHGDFSVKRVDGNADTQLWQPGETYHVEIQRDELDDRLESFPPERVKVVTGPGVTDAEEVTVS